MLRPHDTAESDVLVPGKILGEVRLRSPLGAGASSEVYAADSLSAGKPCAVKVFRRELGIGPVSRGRYAHATHQVDHLGHAGIADTYSFGETPDGRSYAVQKLAPGQSLGEIVRNHGPLPRRIAVPIVRQICSALAVTHAHSIPHLRLHHGNVIVDLSAGDVPRVVLLDFGVCQLHPPPSEPLSALSLGPEHGIWVAPEQVRGEAGDLRTDVYALSVMLYEMICGRAPFLGETYKQTLELHASSPVPSPKQFAAVPAELGATLLRGLEKDPRRRIPSVEALLSAIDPLSATTGHHQALARTHQSRARTLSTGEFQASETRPPSDTATASEPDQPLAFESRNWRRIALIGGLTLTAALLLVVLIWAL